MKKLIVKIVLMMIPVMGCVIGISQLVLLIIRTQNIEISANISYAVSLVSGFLGLILFLVLMEIFVFRRIRKITKAINEVKTGNFSLEMKVRSLDEIDLLIQDFNKMVKQLEANEYLSQEFVKNVSHEFKTPLASIIGYSNLIKQNSQNLNIEQIQNLEIILNQAIHLENMSKQMLLISQLDANMNLMPNSAFNPTEQIQSIILSMQTVWVDQKLEWDLDLDDVRTNNQADLCYCIWQNLISNAIKFANPDTIIRISLKVDHAIHFIITNHGPEINEQEQLMLFKQFYKNKTHANPHGSGLGLALINKILLKLNGSINVKSDAKGTTFSVIIPNVPNDK